MASLGKQQSGQGQNFANASTGVGYSTDVYQGTLGGAIQPDPNWCARNQAADRLYQQMNEHANPRWALTDNMHTDNSSYLPALKSTAPWWRAHVMQERRKRQQRAIDTLQSQIKKLMESPMDKLQEMADEALGAFMAELNKP